MLKLFTGLKVLQATKYLVPAFLFLIMASSNVFALPLRSNGLYEENLPDLSILKEGANLTAPKILQNCSRVEDDSSDLFTHEKASLSGTVELKLGFEQYCSGAVVSFGASPDSKAVIMTNGHCAKFPRQGEFIANKKWKRRQLDIFIDNEKKIRAKTTRIIYSTMTNTDIAFVEADVTYAELKRQGVKVFTLASKPPQKGDGFYFASGHHRFVKDCYVDKTISKINEDEYRWSQMIRYNKECKAIPGSSGSPLISKKTGEVIAINSTMNDINDEGKDCSLNNPCEVDEQGNKSIVPEASYAQQTYELHKCVNEKGVFDHTLESCPLLK